MRGQLPKVSVILPVYNSEPYLRQCLDSVVAQTLTDIEIICVDDGSTDGSWSILQEYGERDGRFVLLRQENAGPGAARDRGLAVARGEYLSLLDSDDIFDPAMLERAYELGAKNRAEIVMFRHRLFDEQTGEYSDTPRMAKTLFPETAVFSVRDVPGNFYYSIFGWTWDKLFLRSFIERLGLQFPHARLHEDMPFAYSALAAAERISYDESVLLSRRVNRADSVSMSMERNWRYVIDMLLATKSFLEIHGLYRTFQKQFTTYALHMLLYNYKMISKQSRKAMRYACSCYAFAALGIDLADPSAFSEPNDREKALKKLAAPQDEVKKLKRENKALKSQLKQLRASKSYRIGRAVTWLPRRLKRLFSRS